MKRALFLVFLAGLPVFALSCPGRQTQSELGRAAARYLER